MHAIVSPFDYVLLLYFGFIEPPPVLGGGHFKGRQSGRKCGDVDESTYVDHGTARLFFGRSEKNSRRKRLKTQGKNSKLKPQAQKVGTF